ncbi:unnamed protein product [Rotaria socialis]|uniref:Helix-turn-helix domain-containing protein n=1 Tax=Rotaria socialis TaxID=392032 RepID=A0A821UD44_9BILA|nr:unnamed protein product [Rotaria socialis]
MMPKREKVQLTYLYFIPKPHKAGTPLRPIVLSMSMPTTGISKFLDKLIRPIFDKHARSITIIDGVDLIHRLEAYTTNGHLIPKTYLYLYTMLPQEESLDILIEFLVQHDYQKVQNIPIDIIRKYVDDIFFTSKDSLESIDQMLDEANSFYSNIKLVRQIRRSVPFLDVFIQNSNGALKKSVYHKEAADPYAVPFGLDHPDHVFRNAVDTAITRAVRYSTNLSQFEKEIRQIKLMFLYNGYPPRHINLRLTTLFSKYLSKIFYFAYVQ